MNAVSEMFGQAQVALAAYANLSQNGSNADALIGAGLSPAQAIRFEQNWRVVDQYPGPSGLSATVFEEVLTGKRYLAIRGTEASDLSDVWTDIVDIAIFGTPERQAQYAALKAKVMQWQTNGTLPLAYTVTGHSLGGFLAGALLVDFPNQIEHTYLYNAPGVGGLSAALRLLLGIDTSPSLDLDKVANVRSVAGVSPIAGLGIAWGNPIPIIIENQLAPDVQGAPAARNHSQQVLTDALAIFDLYSRVDGNLDVNQISAIVKAVTNRNAQTLETSLDALRRLFWQPAAASVVPTPIGDRDALYLNLYEPGFQQWIAAYEGQLQISLLTEYTATDLSSIAYGSEALAYRYALKSLNPFAILGNNELYAPHNQNGELDLYDQTTGQGALTAAYLTDRAAMLGWKNLDFTADGQRALRSSRIETYQFIDKRHKDAFGNDLTIPVAGRQSQSLGIPAKIVFGSEGADTLTGGDVYVGDHLFGGGGDDTLLGNGANDYLEGGAGRDELQGGDGADTLLGMQGDDVLDGGLDNDTLDGGQGSDTYIYRVGDGIDTIIDSDGRGSIRFFAEPTTWFDLHGGKKAGDNLWRSEDERITYTLSSEADGSSTLNVNSTGGTLIVKNFISGQLGIALDDALPPTPPPPMGGREIRGDWAPKPYTDPVTGETFAYRWDELSNVERDSGVPNTTGFSEPDNKLDGSPGPDHIVTGDYEDRAYGFEGDDSITGSALLINILHGGAGNDWIEALGSSSHATDYFEFELDGRVIKLGQGKISGGAGDDYIYGESAESLDRLYDPATLPTGLPGNWSSGGTGDDHIYGSAGDDVLMGGIGKDLLVGGAGQDVLLGDDSYWLYSDMVFWRVVHPYFNDSTAGLGGFELGLFPVVNATLSYPDQVYRITGDPDFTYYKNGGADDVLIGGAGRDILIGQYGDDTLYGGGDDDILAGWEGNDELYGGDGDDLMAGDFGRYEQPNQRNVVAPWLAPAGVRNLVNSDGSVVDQSGRDFLDGGAGNDILFGEGGDDILLGGAGNDTLYGDASYLLEELHGADTLDGGAGNDVLYGHVGIDRLYGGSGDDVLDGGAGNDFLYGSSGNDSLSGGDGDDALEGGDGDDILLGGAGNDILLGGAGNDQLDGGDGDDVLFAGEGENRLEGGDGNDTLYGGSLGDILSGGVGNDRIDAGAGIDIVYGGEGNDTYVLDFNYGRDLFEDAEGANRIEFGAGIAPEQITAEWAGSALTVAYGFGEDALTVDLAQFQLGGIDFADGTSWTKKNLVNTAPRVLTAGSEAAESVEGVLYGRNDLRGLGGNDRITGAGYDDLLAGGAGADTLDGASGSDRYFFTADESGIDRILDSELAGRAYLDWFYENLGIADWEGRARHGGSFEVSLSDEAGVLTIYYGTYEEAFTDYPEAIITYIEPLPEAAPLITRNDMDALDQLVNAGVLARDVVEFGPGLTLADLDITINVNGTVADQHPEQPWYGGGTLAVRWGDAGFDLQLPDVSYGFVGTNLLTDGTDGIGEDLAGSWLGYRLGEGVEAFEFADGATYTLEEVLQQATVVSRYGYEFLRGSGYQVIDRSWDKVDFEAGIQASEVQITSNGADLLITLTDGSAQGRIVDWYADPANMPALAITFDDGTVWSADYLTAEGITLHGTTDDDIIYGTSSPDIIDGGTGNDTLSGDAGNDTLDGGAGDDYLDGGAGDDTYVFRLGSGIDTIIDESGNDTIAFGTGITPDMLTLGLGSLLIGVGDGGDAIHIEGFNPYDVYGSQVIENYEFADGASLTYEALIARGIHIYGSDGDDDLPGTNGPDIIDGGMGNDYLFGDAGNDTYIFGRGYGRDVFAEYDGTLGYIDTVRFASDIAPGDVTVSGENGDLILSTNDTDDQVVLRSWFWDDESKIEQVAFADGTVWDIAALESRVPMAEATEGADLIFGTNGDEIIDGLGGDDQIAGGSGNDVLSGGEGVDYLIGGAGNDILLGGEGADELDDWSGSNYLNAGSGDDLILVNGGASFVIGGSGTDRIENFSEAIVIAYNAGDGQDTVYAATSLTLSLGGGIHATGLSLRREGTDLVLETGATDSIRFTRQWEADPEAWPQITLQLIDGAVSTYDLNEIINQYNELQNTDPTLIGWQIGDALASAQLDSSTGFALGGDLAYHYASTGSNDGLAPEIIRGIVSDPAFGVEPQPFEALAPALTGTTGDDVLTGGNEPDTLIGGAGNDMLDGGAGNDTYVFDPGSGVDVIQDSAGMDTLAFGAGITPGMLTLGLGSLLIKVGDGGDAIHIEGFNPSDVFGSPVIENFAFADGTVLAYNDLLARGFDLAGTESDDVITGTNVADRINGLGGNDALNGGEGDDALDGGAGSDALNGGVGSDTLDGLAGNDALFGRSGNDRLSGGPGDDLLAGGAGDDTYVYQAGDGLDTLADEAGNDTAALGAGLTRDNVVARMSGDNTTARVRVLDAYGNEQADQGLDIALALGGDSPIEWFAFGNGDNASLDDLLIREEAHTGTWRNDVIRTGRNDDTIYADRGNDVVYAGAGNDVLFGDRGRDLLYGEAGNDVLAGGRGKDKLYGGFGDDVLDGGRGTDILDGGAGFDTYVFERGFGDDRIVSSGGSGALRFGAGITARDLSFKRRNDDLVVKVNGDGRIRIEDWFDAKAAHPVARAEFADGTVMNADKFVAKGYDFERERDEDDDADEDGSHYGNDDSAARPRGATNDEDHDDVRAANTPPGHGKSSEIPDSAWFGKVVEKWDAHYARSAQPNAESGDARNGTSHSAQPGNRWQRMHDQLNAHLAAGADDGNDGGADLASVRPGSAHGPSFTQFGSIGYGGVGVEDRSAADLRPFTGLREGLARIA